MRTIVNYVAVCCMGMDGSYTCGEWSIMCRLTESLYCIPEAKVMLSGNNASIKKLKIYK